MVPIYKQTVTSIILDVILEWNLLLPGMVVILSFPQQYIVQADIFRAVANTDAHYFKC